jgi:hypothetical protein
MKYYDPTTRKRPEFNELCNELFNMGKNEARVIYVLCLCGTVLHNQPIVFEHWQQGHFDKYDEVKEA